LWPGGCLPRAAEFPGYHPRTPLSSVGGIPAKLGGAHDSRSAGRFCGLRWWHDGTSKIYSRPPGQAAPVVVLSPGPYVPPARIEPAPRCVCEAVPQEEPEDKILQASKCEVANKAAQPGPPGSASRGGEGERFPHRPSQLGSPSSVHPVWLTRASRQVRPVQVVPESSLPRIPKGSIGIFKVLGNFTRSFREGQRNRAVSRPGSEAVRLPRRREGGRRARSGPAAGTPILQQGCPDQQCERGTTGH